MHSCYLQITKELRNICEMGNLNIYLEQKTAEKNLHSWTEFAVSNGCLLCQRSSDICSQAHDRVSLGFKLQVEREKYKYNVEDICHCHKFVTKNDIVSEFKFQKTTCKHIPYH
jgi:hypothetical protein